MLFAAPQRDLLAQSFRQQGGARFQQECSQVKIATGQVGGRFAEWTLRERIDAENLQ